MDVELPFMIKSEITKKNGKNAGYVSKPKQNKKNEEKLKLSTRSNICRVNE